MSTITVKVSIILGAGILIFITAMAAYWQDRKAGCSHEAALRSSSMIICLLLATSIIDVAEGFAKYI